MTFKVIIGGTDMSADVVASTVEVDLPANRRGATAKFDILDTTLALAINPLTSVLIYDVDGVTPIFNGLITVPEVTVEGVGTLNRWQCTCQDFTYYLDSSLVNKAYTAQTADAIIRDIFNMGLPGITTTNVMVGPVIPHVVFAQMPISQALRKLTKLAQQTAPIIWWLDAQNPCGLHWGMITQLVSSGITLSDRDIDVGAVRYAANSIRYILDGTQITNSVIVRGSTAVSPTYADNFVGNGSQVSFGLAYTPSQTSGSPPIVTENGVAQSVAFDSGGAPTTRWVISNQLYGSDTSIAGTSALRVGTGAAPASGVIVACQYNYDIPILVRLNNPKSITKYAPGSLSSGKHHKQIVDATLRTQNAAIAKAQSQLNSYAFHLPSVTLTIPEQYTGTALAVGSTIQVICSQIALNETMAIIAIKIAGTADGLRRIDLTMEGL